MILLLQIIIAIAIYDFVVFSIKYAIVLIHQRVLRNVVSQVNESLQVQFGDPEPPKSGTPVQPSIH